jgi:TonB family protein
MLRALLAAMLSVSASALAAQEAPAPAERLPLSAFVDSAALVAAVAALSPPELPDGVMPLFQVSFDSAGEATVEPVFDEIPAGHAAAVVGALRANLAAWPAGRGGWTFVRVRAGAAPLVDRPAVRTTGPRLADRVFEEGLTELAQAFARREDVAEGSYRAVLRLRVRADGTPDPATVRLVRAVGDAELDSAVLALVPRMRFHPATVEGIPVRAWVRQPIRFEIPEPPPPPRGRERRRRGGAAPTNASPLQPGERPFAGVVRVGSQ